MSKVEKASEPSMDEILDSIRKIIAEDTTGARPPQPPGSVPLPPPARAHMTPPDIKPPQQKPPPQFSAVDDVLDDFAVRPESKRQGNVPAPPEPSHTTANAAPDEQKWRLPRAAASGEPSPDRPSKMPLLQFGSKSFFGLAPRDVPPPTIPSPAPAERRAVGEFGAFVPSRPASGSPAKTAPSLGLPHERRPNGVADESKPEPNGHDDQHAVSQPAFRAPVADTGKSIHTTDLAPAPPTEGTREIVPPSSPGPMAAGWRGAPVSEQAVKAESYPAVGGEPAPKNAPMQPSARAQATRAESSDEGRSGSTQHPAPVPRFDPATAKPNSSPSDVAVPTARAAPAGDFKSAIAQPVASSAGLATSPPTTGPQALSPPAASGAAQAEAVRVPPMPTLPSVIHAQPAAAKPALSAGQGSSTPAAAPAPEIAGRTMEDTVAEMLRPMLRQWLDANMPRIVGTALRVELGDKKEP